MLTYALKSLVLLLLVFSTLPLDLELFAPVKVLDDEVIVVVVKRDLDVDWLLAGVWGFLLLSSLVIGIVVIVVIVVVGVIILLLVVEVLVVMVAAVVTVVLVAINVVGYRPGAKPLALSLLVAIVLLLLLMSSCCGFWFTIFVESGSCLVNVDLLSVSGFCSFFW